DTVEEATTVRLLDVAVPGFDMGDDAAQWFCDFAGRKLPLVRFDPEDQRLSNPQWTDGVVSATQFKHVYPLRVVGTGSLEALNEKLVAAGRGPVGMERFRPNIVLSGLAPHDEDRLDVMTVATDDGPVALKPAKPCPRCPIPNVDPATAEVDT